MYLSKYHEIPRSPPSPRPHTTLEVHEARKAKEGVERAYTNRNRPPHLDGVHENLCPLLLELPVLLALGVETFPDGKRLAPGPNKMREACMCIAPQ